MRGYTQIKTLLMVSLAVVGVATISDVWAATEATHLKIASSKNKSADVKAMGNFATEVNDIAAKVNLWYAMLLEKNPTLADKKTQRFSLSALTSNSVGSVKKLFEQNSDYYPNRITDVSIVGSTFTSNSQHQHAELKVSLIINTPTKSFSASEVFEFSIENEEVTLINVNRSKKWLNQIEQNEFASPIRFSWLDFAIRYEIYEWVKRQNLYSPHSDNSNEHFLEQFPEVKNAVPTVLGLGDFLVRKIEIKGNDTLDLSPSQVKVYVWLDWKGRSESGKHAIAAVKQELTFSTVNQKDGVKFVLTGVNQEFELPKVAPWEKLLC